jgi:hypothetical protein
MTKTRDVPGLVPSLMHLQMPGYGPPTPVPIFQWEPEFSQLLDLYRELKPKRQAKEWAPYDFIFIDAGHYYPEVRADWDAYLPLAQKGAMVVFHDILPPSVVHPEIEVARLWAEIKADGYDTEEIVADRDADWGGIGVVFLP